MRRSSLRTFTKRFGATVGAAVAVAVFAAIVLATGTGRPSRTGRTDPPGSAPGNDPVAAGTGRRVTMPAGAEGGSARAGSCAEGSGIRPSPAGVLAPRSGSGSGETPPGATGSAAPEAGKRDGERGPRTMSAQEVSALNDAMDAELEAEEIPADFGARMEALFRDRTADEMARNFAVQHLERFAQARAVRGTWDADSEEARRVRAALEDAARETENSLGGTAMLALARLSEIDPHVDRAALASRSVSLVADASALLSSRIAAAQLCGILGVRSALPSLRALAADPSAPAPLRLSASRSVALLEEKPSASPALP